MVLLEGLSSSRAMSIRWHCALAGVCFGSTLARLEVRSMEKCNPFKQFSAVLLPELAQLNLNGKQRRHVLMGLYGLAEERVENEQKREEVIRHLKQLGPRLKKYGQLAAAIKNCQKSLEKALKLSSQLPYPSKRPGPVFPTLLNGAKDMMDEARQNLENSRRFIIGFEIPVLRMSKKLATVDSSESYKAMDELMKQWGKKRGRATFFPTASREEWFEDMGGSDLFELQHEYNLRHLRAKAADHRFIEQADSFLRKNTIAGPTLRIKIVAKALLAAFKEGGDNINMVKTVLDRAAKPKPMKIRRVNPVSKTAPTS
jgi:hypothetical protein